MSWLIDLAYLLQDLTKENPIQGNKQVSNCMGLKFATGTGCGVILKSKESTQPLKSSNLTFTL